MSTLLSVFRWKGLLVFFALLLAFYFSMPFVIKTSLESVFESAFDARSEVDRVKIDYGASQIQVQGVSVADKDAPMTNLFEWADATIDLNFYAALTGRFIIDEMSVSALTFSTARHASGALPITDKTEEKTSTEKEHSDEGLDDQFANLSMVKALPSADVLLAREPLQTLQLAEALDEYSTHQEAAWKSIEDNLPDQASLKAYKQQLSALQHKKIKKLSDFKKAKKELKAIKRALKKDKKLVKEAKVFLTELSVESKKRMKQLKLAPQADFKLLKSKYKLSESGALNVAGLLLGAQVQNLSAQGLSVYKRIKPILVGDNQEEEKTVERLKGHFVHFGRKKPASWVKKLAVTGAYQAHQFEAMLTNLSHQPELIEQPAKLVLNATNTEAVSQALSLEAVIDYREKTNRQENLSLTLTAYPINHWEIVKDKQMHIEILQSQLNLTANISRKAGIANGEGSALFKQVNFDNSGSNTFTREVAAAIAKVKSFDASASFHKNINSLKIKSNLDNQISAAINSRLKEQQKILEKKLKAGINKHLKQAIKNDKLAALLDQETAIDEQLSEINALLKQELDDFEKSEKSKQKKKIKKQLKNKLKSLF